MTCVRHVPCHNSIQITNNPCRKYRVTLHSHSHRLSHRCMPMRDGRSETIAQHIGVWTLRCSQDAEHPAPQALLYRQALLRQLECKRRNYGFPLHNCSAGISSRSSISRRVLLAVRCVTRAVHCPRYYAACGALLQLSLFASTNPEQCGAT
jgi:hypothetical protein